MQKIERKTIFQGFLFILVFLLLLVAYHYRMTYWVSFYGSVPIIKQVVIYAFQAFCIGLAACLILFRKKIYEKRKELLLLLIVSISLALLLEIGSRVYLCNFADHTTKSKFLLYGQCGAKFLYEPHHYLNYHGTPNYQSPDGLNIHNSLGFRGSEIKTPKPEGVYRIFTIGGSTTYSIAVKDWRNDFARKLQKELRETYNYTKIEVINAGLGGWDSWESLINFELNILDLEPDLIIIYQGVNDVVARLVDPALYKGDNSGKRKQWEQKSFPIFFYSTVIRMLTKVDPIRLSHFVDRETTENVKLMNVSNKTYIEILQKNKPVFFERNLRSIIAIVKENNISVLLSTWAHSDQIEGDFISTPPYVLGCKENNDVVKKIAETTPEVFFYDFAKWMPKNKIYWSDGRHLNELGIKLEARLFAKAIDSKKIIHTKK